MLDYGILGINARNLQYIKKFNPKKVIRLADNKQKTKNFLIQRGIPVPETYGIISDRMGLYDFDFSKLPSSNFVVKPNKGSKGRGIYIVEILKDLDNGNLTNSNKLNILDKFFGIGFHSKFNYSYKTGGEIITDDIFRRYLLDILDGRYSLTFGRDKILIEEKLLPGLHFKRFCEYGLADIRVIVFNLIPVAAMVRVPTAESGGKANLAQGGVGLGVEVGSGKIKSMYFKKEIFSKSFPGYFSESYNKKLPFWNDILLYSSKIQYFVNLGYLALDWVITPSGPKLLEINARAGLEVQNASVLKLKNRLEKVSDIQVSDPEKGVEIAQSLFNKSKSNIISSSKVLYLSQNGNLIFESDEKDSIEKVIVRVDLKRDRNFISQNLYNKIEKFSKGDIILDIPENEIRFKNLLFHVSDTLEKNEIILGHGPIADYYVRPIHKIHTEINIINPENIVEEELEKLHVLDQNISKISKKLNFSKILNPINFLDELDNFITWNGSYNPKFIYDWPSDSLLKDLYNQLNVMRDKNFGDNFGIKSKFGILFNDKIEELLIRIKLIKSYKNQKYDNILKYNISLFGEVDKDLLSLSKEKVFIEEYSDQEILGRKLTFSQTKKLIKKYLEDKGINGVRINTQMGLSRIAVGKGKVPEIRVSSAAIFREKELYGTLAHEVDVHLRRFLNGRKTGWEILKSGTGFYITDEEGMAVYNSFKELPDGYEKKAMYEKYYLVNEAANHGFSRLVDIIRGIQPRTLAGAFKTALRLKKGVQNTGFVDKGAIYMKDKIYLDGYKKVSKWVENGGNVEKFMIGKIKIDDIDKIL